MRLVSLAKIVINYCWGVLRTVELTLLSGTYVNRRFKGPVIVSMTSFPGRINNAWITIESILQQDAEIGKIVLILSTQEFPSKHLPNSIRRQLKRGLEVLWVPDNIKSYKKLLSIIAFPGSPIITVDDDIIYSRSCISQLLEIAKKNPGTIIGHRGHRVSYNHDNTVRSYKTWEPIKSFSAGDNIFLTGSGAIYYPPDILAGSIALGFHLGFQLCPTADDVWMWAFSNHHKITRICTGLTSFINSPAQIFSPKLWTVNKKESGNDIHIKTMTAFLESPPASEPG